MFNTHDLVIVQSGFSINYGDKDGSEMIYVPRHTIGMVVGIGKPTISVAFPGIGQFGAPIANVFPIGKGDPELFFGLRVMECLECGGAFPAIYFDFDNALCCKCVRLQGTIELEESSR